MNKNIPQWLYDAKKLIKKRKSMHYISKSKDRFFRLLAQIRQRCLNPKNINYKWYGARGIGVLITVEEIIKLWFRDKAYEMDKPSIDRRDNNGHYTYKNCRFIEMSENSKKSHVDRKFRKFPVNNMLLNS